MWIREGAKCLQHQIFVEHNNPTQTSSKRTDNERNGTQIYLFLSCPAIFLFYLRVGNFFPLGNRSRGVFHEHNENCLHDHEGN